VSNFYKKIGGKKFMNEFLPYLGEFIGTAILVLLGDGVVANVILKRTKGNGGGWVVITLGWAAAVAIPALIFGGNGFTNHFNPALTLGLALTGNFAFGTALGYILAQMLGGFFGAVIVWFMHKSHFEATAIVASDEDYLKAWESGNIKEYVAACQGFCSIEEAQQQIAKAKADDREDAIRQYRAQKADSQATMLAVFSTGPAIRKRWHNFCVEVIATFVLLFALAAGFANGNIGGDPHFGNWGVFILIMGLGMSLGGTTGYSLNPARDLAPRIAHAILPIKGKGKSDWGYAWVPTLGPLVGAILGALVSFALFGGLSAIHW